MPIYLWTRDEYEECTHNISNEVCLDTYNTTHENTLELIQWATEDGFLAEECDGYVRIQRISKKESVSRPFTAKDAEAIKRALLHNMEDN